MKMKYMLKRFCLSYLLLAALLIIGASSGDCKQVDKDEAVAVADLWYAMELNSGLTKLDKAAKTVRLNKVQNRKVKYLVSKDDLRDTPPAKGELLAYIITYDPSGFVVVAGDDRINAIVVFDATSVFRWDEPERNFLRYFLETEMAARTEYIKARADKGEQINVHPNWVKLRNKVKTIKNLEQAVFDAPLTTQSGTTDVLWDTATWNQCDFYNYTVAENNNNNTCIPTGCVATAMAIKMRFHEWPLSGTGGTHIDNDTSGSITGTHSVNFDSIIYNWSAMPTTSLTSANAEVADLMYQCGVAINIDYEEGCCGSGDGSGSFQSLIKTALEDHMRYTGCIYVFSNNIADHEGNIKNSILKGLPANIAGGSHSVVADGYRDTLSPYFHINVGWGNIYNSNTWYNFTDIPATDGAITMSVTFCSPCSQNVGQGATNPEIFSKCYNRNGKVGTLGCPINEVHRWCSGYIQDFRGGEGNESAIMQPDGINEAYAVYGSIWQKYKSSELGGACGIPGYPITDETEGTPSSITDAQNRYNNFQGGSIQHHATGPRAGLTVWLGHGIKNKWAAIGYGGSVLGLPISDEREATQSFLGTTGVVADFENGHIHWHRNGIVENQAFETHGPLDQFYAQNYGSGSWLGFPVNNQYINPSGYPECVFEGGYITTSNGINYNAYPYGSSSTTTIIPTTSTSALTTIPPTTTPTTIPTTSVLTTTTSQIPTEIITLATGLSNPTDIAVDDTSVYWTEYGSGTVKKISINGGSVTTLVSGLYSVSGLTVDGSYVYFAENVGINAANIKKVPKNGGSVITLASNQPSAWKVAVDVSNVYWTDGYGGSIRKVPINGGSFSVLATGSSSPAGIAIDNTNVYWSEFINPGTIKKVSKSGGAVTTLANNSNTPGIAVYGNNVYWTEGIYVNQGKVNKVSTNGGIVTNLATGLYYPWDVATDGTYVFWVEYYSGGSVKQVHSLGGSVITLANGLSDPVAVATDSTFVYWIETTGASGGSLKKVVKGFTPPPTTSTTIPTTSSSSSSSTVLPTSTTTTAVITTTTSAAPSDVDNDGVPDTIDNCPNKSNGPNLGTCSSTSDKAGVTCTSDADCVIGCSVNGQCLKSQEDTDNDGAGDICDNCPNDCNAQQLDADGDGIGDVCDTDPGCGGCSGVACEQTCVSSSTSTIQPTTTTQLITTSVPLSTSTTIPPTSTTIEPPITTTSIPTTTTTSIDLYEDFTTYTKIDPNNVLTVNSNSISYLNSSDAEDAYVYKDFGVDYFNGDFIHDIDVKITNIAMNAVKIVWMLSNSINDMNDMDIHHNDYLCVYFGLTGSGRELLLREFDNGTGYYDLYNWELNTDYYLRIVRDESIGTYGQLSCYIYSDSQRTALIHALTIPLHSSKDYRYLYAFNTYNDNGSRFTSGINSNLKIQ